MRFLRFLVIGLDLLACERTPPSAPPAHVTSSESPPGPVTGACGKMPGRPVERVQWLHGKGDARCDELETRWANVPHADRACRADDECTVVAGDGNCFLSPLTKSAALRSEYQAAPCGNPASGACPGDRTVARCLKGCCVVE